MKKFFYNNDSLNPKDNDLKAPSLKSEDVILNNKTKNDSLDEKKKIKKIKKIKFLENALFLSEFVWSDDNLNFFPEEDEEEKNEIIVEEKEITYLEKQNNFFKEYKNIAKKIPYEIAFTQEIEIDSSTNKMCKSLSSIETSDHDKIFPKNNKKEIELLKNKDKLSLLFNKDKNN